MKTILVTDKPDSWKFLKSIAPIVKAHDYLSNVYHQTNSMRVINLCHSYDYQSIGYYVSLLAQARDHKAIPSVLGLQDTLNNTLSKLISEDVEQDLQHNLSHIKGDEFIFSLYFGKNIAQRYAKLAKKLHGLFPLPLIRFTIEKKRIWSVKKVKLLSPEDIPDNHLSFMQEAAISYFKKKRFHQWHKKQRYHDLAILIDPNEENAPSNKKALESFVHAGESLGLNVDFLDKHDAKAVPEYDALFIRATTAVDHYTYNFARRASQENLVVIDDPQSIVRCANKVYLAELLRHHNIRTPKTTFVSKYDKKLPKIAFPCVLKKPDSAFSHGVIKITDETALEKNLNQFFKTSDLIVLQPFIPTQYDWRIGILNNKPLFACKYYMAKNHWQIYNWASKHESEGANETIPLNKVPDEVIQIALKATRLIGDGLYGVDIKVHKNRAYVIEINDNPNIDADIEDRILKDSLYLQIMNVFLERIRRKHGYA